MGEGLKQMFFVSSSPSSPRAEDDDEVGENSDPDEAGGESSPKDSSLGHRHEFSGLVSHLPVKKGLSKFYHGKSQSFSSLSDVRTAEDLAKKETTIKRAMKPCRSYAGGLNHDETDSAPTSKAAQNNKAMIANKGNPRSSCAHLIARTTSGSSYFAGSKPPAIPTHNKRLA